MENGASRQQTVVEWISARFVRFLWLFLQPGFVLSYDFEYFYDKLIFCFISVVDLRSRLCFPIVCEIKIDSMDNGGQYLRLGTPSCQGLLDLLDS